MDNADKKTFDVAVVGFGPVGATLAAMLGQRGRRVLVVDKSEQIYPLPRAFALDHEAMRIFQQVGIAGALAAHMTPYRPTLYLGADGEPIQHFDMGPAPYPLAWAPSYTFNQPALETALRQAVSQLTNVDVRLGCEVEGVQDAGSGAGASLSVRMRDGTLQQLRARHVVACDGGASPMRKRLGLQLKSLEFDEPWIVVDMHVDSDQLDRLPATNIQYCNPARPCTYVVGPGTHRRWEFLLLPHEAEQRELPHEAIWQLLEPWLKPGQGRIWRAATYRFHAVVLNQWRQGAVLLAGDAAHQMPPFLAQGMCQGLRDAANLAWKLDWVLGGRANESLLDTYGQERAPQVEALTATVKRLGQIICERDPARAVERDRTLREQQGGQVRMQLRQALLPGVRHGLIDGDDAPAGAPFPQPLCQAGSDGAAQGVQMMDDLLPRDYLLVLRNAPTAEQTQAWAGGLARLQAQMVCFGEQPFTAGVRWLAESDGVVARWFAQHSCEAALVRPDHIVHGVAARAGQVTELLARAGRQIDAVQPVAHTATAAA